MKYQTVYFRTYFFALFYFLLISGTVSAQGLWLIFCSECTSLENNSHQTLEIETSIKDLSAKEYSLLADIQAFEQGLNPDTPQNSKIIPEIIGQGSTSIGFRIPDWEHFHIRRLAGFQNYQDAKKHILLINEYRRRLHELSINTTQTQLIALEDSNAYGVVYVIQPFLDGNRLSKHMLKIYGEPFKKRLLEKQADIAEKIIGHNIKNKKSAITVDIVNNNWEIVDFNPDTFSFDIRLNDIAQPLFKEDGEITYDFYDLAFSIISPLSWLLARDEIHNEFAELFHPRNLLTQALWGYDEPMDLPMWQYYYHSVSGSPPPRSYPKWAMETVNSVLTSFNYKPIDPKEVLAGHHEDIDAIGCLYMYRDASQNFRSRLGLNSNVYMSAGKTVAEMYANKNKPKPSYSGCLLSAAKDALMELFYGKPSYQD